MSEHNRRSRLEPPRYRTYYMALEHEREALYDRIDRRVDVMMQQGLLEEVRQCVALGAGRQHTSMQAIGYRADVGLSGGRQFFGGSGGQNQTGKPPVCQTAIDMVPAQCTVLEETGGYSGSGNHKMGER